MIFFCEGDFPIIREIVVISLIDELCPMLDGIKVANILASIGPVRYEVNNLISKCLLLFNTEKYTVGKAAN